MKYNCTGVILAGGTNSRLPGMKKAFHRIGENMILENIVTVFRQLFNEIILVVNDPQDFAGWDVMVVTDIIPSRCALAGLHAGLFYSANEYAYITACDTPFINKEIIEYIVGQIDPSLDVIVPKTKDGLEALSAVYSRKILPSIESNLEKNIYMIKKCYPKNRVKYIPSDDLKQFDPDLQFIFNINTPTDLDTARKIIKNKSQRSSNHGYSDHDR